MRPVQVLGLPSGVLPCGKVWPSDGLKLAIHQRLGHGDTLTIADTLGKDYLDQLGAERLVTRYSRGHPVRRWEAVSGRRNEAFDCLVYALAARHLVGVKMGAREADLTLFGGGKPKFPVAKSKWLTGDA